MTALPWLPKGHCSLPYSWAWKMGAFAVPWRGFLTWFVRSTEIWLELTVLRQELSAHTNAWDLLKVSGLRMGRQRRRSVCQITSLKCLRI